MALLGPVSSLLPLRMLSLFCLELSKFLKSIRLKGYLYVWVVLWVDLIQKSPTLDLF